MDMQMHTDLLVIGAGYAGLTAAAIAREAGKSVVVLEARDRVGGRVWTDHLPDGLYIDRGAQWVGPGQEKLYALAHRMGVDTFPTHDTGESILLMDNRLKRYKGLIPPLPLPALLSLDMAIKKMNRLSSGIDPSAPWTHPKADAWDAITLGQWMRRQLRNTRARKLFTIAAEAIFATSPDELSFLFSLFYTRSGNNFDTLMNIRNGAQQDRFLGGADLPAKRLAGTLGDAIKTGHAVRHIHQDAHGVRAAGDGFEYTAHTMILALPPVQAARIRFEPGLPVDKQQLLQRMPMGCVWKCYAAYDSPFWRSKGLSGIAATNFGYTSLVFDNSPKDGQKGILMAFVLADKARDFSRLDEPQRRASILESFTQLYGKDAEDPVWYTDQCWTNEAWSGGCYTGIMGPHTLTSLGPVLRAPTGRIHWAGTETADIWNGYIEGAIRSGERAAAEVLAYP
jgi:monoamine oxidase